jgi:hypothetical protein
VLLSILGDVLLGLSGFLRCFSTCLWRCHFDVFRSGFKT